MAKEDFPTVMSVHIEKTAGTSGVRIFEEIVGREHLAFYDPLSDPLTRSSELVVAQSSKLLDTLQLRYNPLWPTVKKVTNWLRSGQGEGITVPDNIDVVHGHFRADRFDGIIENQLPVVVFREPLERMRSQYDHWRRTKGKDAWRVTTPYIEGMSFEEYAMQPALLDYQTQALGGKDLTDFAAIGITEDLQPYTEKVITLLDQKGLSRSSQANFTLPHINKTPARRRSGLDTVSRGFVSEFQRAHAGDYEIYRAATALNQG